jgi:hypothetical protein
MNLYIDEADEFLEARGEFVQLDSRVFHQSPKHKFDVAECKARKKVPDACNKCSLVRGTLSVGYDREGVLTLWNQSGEGKVDKNFEKFTPLLGAAWGITPEETEAHSVYRRTGLKVSPLSGGLKSAIEVKAFDADIQKDSKAAAQVALRVRMDDWMYPAIWTHEPYEYEGRRVYPGMICEGRFLAGIDLGPVKWVGRLLAKAQDGRKVRVRMATGTWDPVHAEMLQQAGLAPKTIAARSEAPKMEEVLLVAYRDRLVQSRRWSLVRGVQGRHRVLNFLARKSAIWYDSNRAPPDIFQKRYEARGYHIDSSRDDDHHDILTTYVRSSLGRGVNLPEYDAVIVEADATQPAATTLASGGTIGAHAQAVVERAARIIDQAVFRVLRRRKGDPGRRVVILHNLPDDKSDREALLAKIEGEIRSRSVHAHVVNARTALAVEEYAHAFLLQGLPPSSVTLSVAALPKKERAAVRREVAASREREHAEKMIQRAVEMLAAGATIREIQTATHWRRKFKQWSPSLAPLMQRAVEEGFPFQRLPHVAPIAIFYSDLWNV